MIFNRFTRDARRCVEAAVEETRALGHGMVGDEHILLGVLADGGIAAEALSSLGVTLQDAREEAGNMFAGSLASIGISLDEVRERVGDDFEWRNRSPGRLPFSPRAKKTLEEALREALRLQDNEITSEHILLGLLRDERGAAARLLAGLGVPARDVEARLTEMRTRVGG